MASIQVHAATIRHLPGDISAHAALQALGWQMPTATCTLARQSVHGSSSGEALLVWRSPEEVLALCMPTGNPNPFNVVLQSLAAGQSATAIAADVSHALAVFVLADPDLDSWLARLVDAASIPLAGQATTARLGDFSALLVRPDAVQVLLVIERTLGPYISDWLTYAHEGTYVETA